MSWLHAFIDVPTDEWARAADFWARVLGWDAGESWDGYPELRSFVPPHGTPYVHLQEIGGPPRVHLDLESEEPDATVERARVLGAAYVGDHGMWQTLTSPGGLPFCVVDTGRQLRPDAVAWPDGHRSRMVQLCIDSPSAVHEAEVSFWRELLGGRWVEFSAREFTGKWHDDAGSPLQLLFQRLDEPDGPVRVHLDHGTDDVAAEVRRLLAIGAADLGRGRAWHVLHDPAGLPFCVTGNSPEPTTLRELG